MIDQGVTVILAACNANTNGVDNHNSGAGAKRNELATRECTYLDFMKCQPLNFKDTEGVVKLTQWIEKMETVFYISNCSMENLIKFSTCTLLGNALTWSGSRLDTAYPCIGYGVLGISWSRDDKNGYTKNHKKTVKNEQARTRESEEYKKKPKNQSRSQKSQASVKSWSTKVNKIHNIPF
ncbi:hypothetical protein Tco_0195424 [Tanacetum coccineum]